MNDGTRTRLHLVRHCDVHNPRGVLYGHLPNFPLSEKGVRQAHALGRTLAESGSRRLFSSPLERAQQTARIIAEYLPNPEIITTADLVEAEFGRYLQGVQVAQVPWRRPLWLIHMAWPGLLPNDENVGAMAARVRRPVEASLRERPGESAILVSHGDPIQAFWLATEGRRPYALHRLQCAKGGRLQLDYEGTRLVDKLYIPPTEQAALRDHDAPVADPSHG